MSKKTAQPIRILYTQHGIDVTAYPRDPDSWPPFRSPLFEVAEGMSGMAPGERWTSCIAIPEPRRATLRRAVAFGLSEAERDAIHEFLGNEQRQLEREGRSEIEEESRMQMLSCDEDDAQPSLF